MKGRRLIVLLVIAAVASLNTSSTPLAAGSNFAPTPPATTIQMMSGTMQATNVDEGNRTTPHLACNLATYTEDEERFQG